MKLHDRIPQLAEVQEPAWVLVVATVWARQVLEQVLRPVRAVLQPDEQELETQSLQRVVVADRQPIVAAVAVAVADVVVAAVVVVLDVARLALLLDASAPLVPRHTLHQLHRDLVEKSCNHQAKIC